MCVVLGTGSKAAAVHSYQQGILEADSLPKTHSYCGPATPEICGCCCPKPLFTVSITTSVSSFGLCPKSFQSLFCLCISKNCNAWEVAMKKKSKKSKWQFYGLGDQKWKAFSEGNVQLTLCGSKGHINCSLGSNLLADWQATSCLSEH